MSLSVSACRWQVLGAAVLFSTGGAAIKACALGPWQVASFRSGIAAAALLLLLPGGRGLFAPRALLVGVFYAMTLVCFVVANKLTTAGNTIFLQATAPLYLLLLGPWLLREPVRRSDLAMISAIAAGMVLFFVGHESPQSTAPEPARGNLVAAASGLSWAATLLGLRWLGRDAGLQTGAAVVAGNLIAFLICLPAALPVQAMRGIDLGILSFLGLFQIALGYFFLNRGVGGLTALELSLLLLLEPVLSVCWAWVVHDERPGMWALGGAVVILGATLSRAALHRPADPTRSATPKIDA